MDVSNRYNSLNNFLRNKFGAKVYKISLRGGFSCPNRDGTKDSSGCIYCNPDSIQPLVAKGKTIHEQVLEGIGYMKKRHSAEKFISYFQHYSNTYGDIKKLKDLYSEAITHPEIVGLAISTRPDCLNSEVLDLLKQLNDKTYLWIELGLQSSHDKTLKLLNRKHSVEDFTNTIKNLHDKGIDTCAHVILGLPEESHEDMMNTIDYLVDLKVGGIKIHNLHILKDTKLAEMYLAGQFKPLELKEYAKLVVDCLELLPKKMLIHRFNSHSPRQLTIAPECSVNKLATLNAVHEELVRRDSWQGKLVTH